MPLTRNVLFKTPFLVPTWLTFRLSGILVPGGQLLLEQHFPPSGQPISSPGPSHRPSLRPLSKETWGAPHGGHCTGGVRMGPRGLGGYLVVAPYSRMVAVPGVPAFRWGLETPQNSSSPSRLQRLVAREKRGALGAGLCAEPPQELLSMLCTS